MAATLTSSLELLRNRLLRVQRGGTMTNNLRLLRDPTSFLVFLANNYRYHRNLRRHPLVNGIRANDLSRGTVGR